MAHSSADRSSLKCDALLKGNRVMNVLFAGKTFDAQHLETYITRCKPHDVIVLAGVLFEVETVQNDCPQWDSEKVFCNVVLKDATGQRIYSRDLSGKIEVYRRK